MSVEQRLPPNSSDAERAVLGGLLIDPDSIYDVGQLHHSHFFSAKNGQIFRIIRELVEDGKPIDIVLIAEKLPQDQQAYLIGLMNVVPTAVQTKEYAAIVWKLAKLRELIKGANQVATIAWDAESAPIDTTLSEVQKLIIDITSDIPSKGPRIVSAGISALMDRVLAKIAERDEPARSFKTGFIDVDRMLRQLEAGNLYIIAGRPGMGKSMFENNIRLNVARRGGHVLACNLEMSEEQLIARMLSVDARVDHDDIRWGNIDEEQLSAVGAASEAVRNLPIWIDDTPSLRISQLHGKAGRIKSQFGLDLITIDYLQLMESDRIYQSRVNEVSEISRGLKMVAKDIGVPIIALSQLSRSCEMRQDKRPVLSDLRDSGSIEQDADVVMFLYRDAYYDDFNMEPNLAELNVAKNRHGKTGKVNLFYKPEFAMFGNYGNGS